MKQTLHTLTRAMAALAAAVVVTTAPALAQGSNPFAPAVIVNGIGVTQYQVDQRFAFLTLLRAPGVTPESVQEVLVSETLQVQAARAAGVSLTPEQLDQEMVAFSSRTNLSPEDFIKAIGANGVAPETFRDFVRNGVYWRQVVQQRFGPRAQVTEAEIDRALASGQGSARVLLSEIALPIDPQNPQAAPALAERLSRTIDSTAEFAAAARRYSKSPSARNSGRLDWVPLANLPPRITSQVLVLGPGETSQPVNMGAFIALFQLRQIEELQPTVPSALSVEYADLAVPTMQDAQQVRARVDTCDDLYGVAKDLPREALTRQVALVSELPADLALELAKLDNGEISTALRGPANFVRVVMMCGRTAQLEDGARDQVRAQLFQQRLETYADGYLQELRADAIITRPGN